MADIRWDKFQPEWLSGIFHRWVIHPFLAVHVEKKKKMCRWFITEMLNSEGNVCSTHPTKWGGLKNYTLFSFPLEILCCRILMNQLTQSKNYRPGAVGCFSLAENRLLGILQVRSNTTCHLCRADNRKQRKNYNGFATTIPFACIHVLS